MHSQRYSSHPPPCSSMSTIPNAPVSSLRRPLSAERVSSAVSQKGISSISSMSSSTTGCVSSSMIPSSSTTISTTSRVAGSGTTQSKHAPSQSSAPSAGTTTGGPLPVPTKRRPEIEYVTVVEKHKDGRTKEYVRGRFLGKGGFAHCYEMEEAETGNRFAGKIIPKSSLTKPKSLQKLHTEIKIHHFLSRKDNQGAGGHRNIVHFYHHFEDDENVYIILERCNSQTLMELVKRRRTLCEPEARFFMKQILEGVKFIHTHRVIHRDLKLGNLFLNSNFDIKIGDFGLATMLENDKDRKRTICGTPNYIAPEVLDNKQGHSYEVDAWSLGVILYTMLFGRPPFETKDVKSTYKRIRANMYEIPEDATVSEEAKELIRMTLRLDPVERFTVDEMLQSPFFQNYLTPTTLPDVSRREDPTPYLSEKYFKKISSNSNVENMIRSFSSCQLENYSESNNENVAGSSRSSSAMQPVSSSSASQYRAIHRHVEADDQKCLENMHEFIEKSFAIHEEKENENRNQPVQSEKAVIMKDRSIQNRLPLQPANINSPPSRKAEAGSKKKEIPTHQPLSDINLPGVQECQPPSLWITRFVDYSTKYGLAYMMNDNSVGVHYNDSTKMILNDDGSIEYYERKKSPEGAYDEYHLMNLEEYPESLKKKITLIKYFRSHLLEGKTGTVSGANDNRDQLAKSSVRGVDHLVYLKRWVENQHAFVFRLSNKSVQVCFKDGTELFLSSGARIVTYTGMDHPRRAYFLSTVMENPHPDIAKRLKFTKDVLYQLINAQRAPEQKGENGQEVDAQGNIRRVVEALQQDPVFAPPTKDKNIRHKDQLGC